jgi:hypothetical protein
MIKTVDKSPLSKTAQEIIDLANILYEEGEGSATWNEALCRALDIRQLERDERAERGGE